MNYINDVVALGEILIDFTQTGLSKQGNIIFEQNPGGAPANVLVCLAKLGLKTAFIGKVGDDTFGNFLIDILKKQNISVENVRVSKKHKTTLAFVQLDENGERSFSFYRNPGADTTLSPEEINAELIENSKLFHFGSISLTDEPERSATLSALDLAKKFGLIISYDPNLRPPLWRNLEIAKERIISVIEYADILKISLEELEFITGSDNIEEGSKEIEEKYKTKIILVSLGAEGCYYRIGDVDGKVETLKPDKVIDTTGAGDSFLGGFLYYLLSNDILIKDINIYTIEKMLKFANTTASLCVLKNGAIPAMPDIESVYQLLINK